MTGKGARIGRREVKSRRRRDGLIKYAVNKTSQSGEDGIIERIFDVLSQDSDKEGTRICVDIGAWDGVHLSNTYSLLVPEKIDKCTKTDDLNRKSKWRGILMEADKKRFEQLRSLHEPLGNICLSVEVSCISESPRSLSYILRHQSKNIPINFDFLSIDVDGPDYWIMEDVLRAGKYTPKLICVEFNPSMPDDLIYIQERSDAVRHGSSLSALFQLAIEYDYVLVETTLYNAFFIRKSLYIKYFQKEVPDPTIEALHENTMGTSLYQLYDGTLKISGCKKMLWHRIPIDEKKIQVLPVQERSFPFAPCTNETTKYNEIREKAIDMSPYCNKDIFHSNDMLEAKKTCASQLFSQFQSNGFAFIHGTGLSSTLVQNGLKATKSFLQEADESVRRSTLTKDRARRGYSPINTENFASLLGEKGHNDLVRKFRIGPLHDPIDEYENDVSEQSNLLPANGNTSKTPYKQNYSPLLSPNVWPKEGPFWDVDQDQFFRHSIEQYYEKSCEIANHVVEAICDGIIARSDVNIHPCLKAVQCNHESISHTSILTLLSYRIGSRHKGKLDRPLVASHTDVGVITILIFDNGNCATLQRKSSRDDKSDNEWVNVDLPHDFSDDPVFVVNIGDCLSDLSDNSLPSTLHRVMPLQGKESRNCLALFVGLNPDAELVLPSGETMKYEEWRRQRIAKAAKVFNS